ncbi:phospholipid phosphatase-related protein type 2-like [Phaenicophaeus curvirostris]|uniref:phospholipid phosphatase-related protein type 2-like n=1 Tax=Phaenicophaeus curvirostris TaxID=33595 RepID=UPI0037F0E1A5
MAPPRREVKRSGSIVPCFLFVELGILGGTAALAYQLEFTDAFPVHDGGFFCRDPAYGRPYPGPPGSSRAPPALVYGLVTTVPVLTIVVGELLGRLGGARGGRDPTILWGECCYLGAPLRRLLRFLGVFSFGLLATAIFANAGQVVTGAPAPHFLAVCRPNYSALGCAPRAGDAPPHFVPPGGAPCNGDPPSVAAARRAFPCKEAALGAYAGAYAGLYVTLAWRGGGSRLAKPAAVLGFAAPPFLLGALRVAEHRNHWGDVLAGFLTGTGIAAFLVTCVVGNFQSGGGSGRGGQGGTPKGPPRAAAPPAPSGGDQRHPGASSRPPRRHLNVLSPGGTPKTGGSPKLGGIPKVEGGHTRILYGGPDGALIEPFIKPLQSH